VVAVVEEVMTNEYLASCLALPKPFLSWRSGFPSSSWDTVDHRRWDQIFREDYRWPMIERYAFAIPNDEAIAVLVALSPIVEIGAGRGYWASLLREAGADVLAFDTYPKKYGQGYNGWWQPGKGEAWTTILRGGPEQAGRYPDRTLFLCWPPMSDMAARALRVYRGQAVAYVGEGGSGCTANSAFHTALERGWTVESEVTIPQWDAIHDYLTIYRRKGR
jgi:hypothetical protein